MTLGVASLGCGTGCGADDPAPQHTTNHQTAGQENRAEVPDPPTVVAMPGVSISRPRAVGTNLASPTYWSRNAPFVDLFKHTDAWISGTVDEWDDHRNLPLDEQGWVQSLRPGQIARTFLIGGEQTHVTGRFTVLYEGRGEIRYHGRIEHLEQSTGRATFDLSGTDGLYLEIHATSVDDPIRNIRVFPPGGSCAGAPLSACLQHSECPPDGDAAPRCVPFEDTYAAQPFHPTFLSEVAPFAVLRFMDWQDTNRMRVLTDGGEEAHPIRTSAQLPVRASARWRPVPVDVMVDLANLLDADPWFCMPPLADDDLVRRFAERVAARLEPERSPYVEVGNELWNDIFDQHQWFNARGCEAYADNPARDCDPDGNGVLCEYTAWDATQERCVQHGRRYLAQRSVEVGRIWREAFEGHRPERVQRVVASQIGGGEDWWIADLLERDVGGQPAHAQLDVVAVAPYFGGGFVPESVDDIFVRTERAGAEVYRLLAARDSVYDWIQKDVRALARLGDSVRYVTYEGGQHLHHHEESRMAHVLRANADPRMETLYGEYLTMWSQLTDDALFVHFTSPSGWNQYGAWGSKAFQGQPLEDAPKHRALLRYVSGH
jgi:hypothetical protein